jgi:hypothetical protein
VQSLPPAKNTAKTASSKGLFTGLDLTHPILLGTDLGFQAVPDLDLNLQQSSLRHIKWILVIEKEVRIFAFTLTDWTQC